MSIPVQKPNTPNSGGLRGAEYDVKYFNNFSSPVTRTNFFYPVNTLLQGVHGFSLFSLGLSLVFIWSLFGSRLFFPVKF